LFEVYKSSSYEEDAEEAGLGIERVRIGFF